MLMPALPIARCRPAAAPPLRIVVRLCALAAFAVVPVLGGATAARAQGAPPPDAPAAPAEPTAAERERGAQAFAELAGRLGALGRVEYTAETTQEMRLRMEGRVRESVDRVRLEVRFDRAAGVRRTYRFDDGSEVVVALDAAEAARRAAVGARDPELDAHEEAPAARAALDPLRELLLGAAPPGKSLARHAWVRTATGLVARSVEEPAPAGRGGDVTYELRLDDSGALVGAVVDVDSGDARGGLTLRFATRYTAFSTPAEPFPAGTFPEPLGAAGAAPGAAPAGTPAAGPLPVGPPWVALRERYARIPRATYEVVRRVPSRAGGEETVGSWTVAFDRAHGLAVEGAFGTSGAGALKGDGRRLWKSEGRVDDPADRIFVEVQGGMQELADVMHQDLVLLALAGARLTRSMSTMQLESLTWTEQEGELVGVRGRGDDRLELRLALDAEDRLARWRLASGSDPADIYSINVYEVRGFAVPDSLPADRFTPPPARELRHWDDLVARYRGVERLVYEAEVVEVTRSGGSAPARTLGSRRVAFERPGRFRVEARTGSGDDALVTAAICDGETLRTHVSIGGRARSTVRKASNAAFASELRDEVLLDVLLDRKGFGAARWSREPFAVMADGSWEAQSGDSRLSLRFGPDGRIASWRITGRTLADLIVTTDVRLREANEPAAFPAGTFTEGSADPEGRSPGAPGK